MDVLTLRANMVREWRRWVPKVANVVKSILPSAEIYVVGSVVREEAIGSSDVDMVIVLSRKLSPREEAELKALIERKANLPLYHPLEIHFTTAEEAAKFLKDRYVKL